MLNVEPLGTFFLPNIHLVDVRVAKRVNLGGARSVELRFDIYNALNKGTVRTQTLRSGANYLRPATILFPRILQIGVNVQLLDRAGLRSGGFMMGALPRGGAPIAFGSPSRFWISFERAVVSFDFPLTAIPCGITVCSIPAS